MAEETLVCGQTDALWVPQMNVALSDFNEEANPGRNAADLGTHFFLWGGKAKKHPAHWTLGLTLSEQLQHTHTFSLSLEKNRKTSRVLFKKNYSRQYLKTEAGRHLMANS